MKACQKLGQVLSLNMSVARKSVNSRFGKVNFSRIRSIIFRYDRQELMKTGLDAKEWMYCVGHKTKRQRWTRHDK